MKLLTAELIKTLPPIGATADQGDAALARAKFFTPWAS
jgi:hypothetical protein